ncbi:dephospho-CoA kinase [bacterium 1xD42-62]|uniref:Dephospho-CoA kinase n=2 Tax=Parablautia muri TaxID=2320879 RepID=A0A9X5BDF2_9FIRM|nr:dephospho-CoA kinase [Parablautia muri]
MKVIGITGGVGSGKTAVLEYIAGKYNCKVILADKAAHKVEEPGQLCYKKLVKLLSGNILNEDGTINREKMAVRIFGSDKLLEEVNKIIHPAVKQFILEEMERERKAGALDFLFIEAALLIENGYLDIVDEMWYIYALENVRRRRLIGARNYSDEKVTSIMKSQLSEEEFKKHCKVVIDNSGELAVAYKQVDKKLGEYLYG